MAFLLFVSVCKCKQSMIVIDHLADKFKFQWNRWWVHEMNVDMGETVLGFVICGTEQWPFRLSLPEVSLIIQNCG